MTRPACLREFKTHAIRHQNIQHTPQQMRATPPSDRIEDDDQAVWPFGDGRESMRRMQWKIASMTASRVN
jgi:hypothetical protein